MTEISSLALITRIFLRALPNEILIFKRRYFCTCIHSFESSVRSFLLAKLLGSITRFKSSKKTSHFPHQLNEDFEALLKRARNLFGFRNLMVKCLKLLTKANFCYKLIKIVAMFAIGLPSRKRIALRTICGFD